MTDIGTAYELSQGRHISELTEVGRGTPMGELLRRYWHPIGIAADAGTTPRRIMALGEELILFRDGEGRAGLVHPRCCHRGTTLYYGKVEQRGIRCCYHGWLFDVQGHCLEQPCEPEGGRQRDRVRQPWYPVEERYGLIFAYMGPPAKRPVLPRYEALEVLAEGEYIAADDTSIGSGGGVIVPCNWLQHWENVVDPYHVPILHGSFSGTQFVEMMGTMPEVQFETSAHGITVRSQRRLDDGRFFDRVTEAVLPTLRVVPSPLVGQFARVESIGWVLPMDDTSFRIYVAARIRKPEDLMMRSRYNGKTWFELTEAEHQLYPGDWEAQAGQGPITFHNHEHLATSDRGVAMARRALKRQVDAVARGEDPVGVSFDPEAPMVTFEAGNFIRGQT